MINSYTSPTLDDVELDDDGTYEWDCCNADYCSNHRKKVFKPYCLKGGYSSRCSRDEKWEIRQKAIANGFRFPNVL